MVIFMKAHGKIREFAIRLVVKLPAKLYLRIRVEVFKIKINKRIKLKLIIRFREFYISHPRKCLKHHPSGFLQGVMNTHDLKDCLVRDKIKPRVLSSALFNILDHNIFQLVGFSCVFVVLYKLPIHVGPIDISIVFLKVCFCI